MNITIFPTGKGGVQSAVRYLLSDIDHEKKKRSFPPEILFGNPDTFTEIANSTNRLHKYTSGVIAFRDHESLTPEQIDTLIETFRSTFLPGLKADENYADFWVTHRDKANLELHFIFANSELTSGQQINIHPPGQKNINFFNSFVAVMNHNFGFAQVVPDPLKIALKPFEAKSPSGKRDKKAKHEVATLLHSRILDGSIANRDQLIAFIEDNVGPVTRAGEDYISVLLPGAAKPKRLRGELFQACADYKELVAAHHQSKIPKFLTPTEAQEHQDKLLTCIRARAAFNQRRYLTPRPGAKRLHRLTTAATQPVKDPAPTLQKQLTQLREQADPATKLPTANLPHRVARRKHENAVASMLGCTSVALGGLEAQIGAASMQYHQLLLSLAAATGKRAATLKAQIMAVEQKLIALNLELQKKKAQATKDKEPKYK